MSERNERIVVVGAGTMGHGIAQVAAMAGYPVTLCDLDAQVLERATQRIFANLDKGIARNKLTAEDRGRVEANLRSSPDAVAAAAAGATLVIEAVVEQLGAKRRLFGAIEPVVDPDCLLGSNTSSLPLGKIAEGLARPQQLIGMHFFNPVHIMRLVEVVVHQATSDEARARTLALVERLGKEPIVVRDFPGFASSRLGVVLGLEAMRMVEQGVASVEHIDKAMELGYNHPMGPLRLTDLVGLDVRLAIAETLHSELGGEQYRAPEILRAKVAAGELGKKTGRGFYDWTD